MARILVVDDEEVMVKGIRFNLENEGYQVECAYDGAAAVELSPFTRGSLAWLPTMVDWPSVLPASASLL